MTTKPAWSHLPNAKHIDAVLADARKRPGAWDAARTAARRAAWGAVQDAAWTAAWDEARDAVRGAAWDAVRAAVWDAVWDAAWGALAALIAWDSSADLLECTPDVLRTMIDLAEPPVCHQAALLLPYTTLRSNDK
jgi:hypothetical protein